MEVKYIHIGDLTVKVTRGERTPPRLQNRSQYQALRDMVRTLNPGEPCLEIPLSDFETGRKIRNSVQSMSCYADRNTHRRSLVRLPWPRMIRTEWLPYDNSDFQGPGRLRIWVTNRDEGSE